MCPCTLVVSQSNHEPSRRLVLRQAQDERGTEASSSREESGSVSTNRAPPSAPCSARTLPPCSSIRCFTIASPSPVPPGSRARDLSERRVNAFDRRVTHQSI